MSPSNLRPGTRALLAIVLGTWFVLGGCGRSTPGSRLNGHRVSIPRDVSALTLPEVRADGRSTPFAFRARPGGLLLAYFGFASCPDVCPTTLADVRKAFELLGPDAARVGLAFVTVDPVRDSAGVLAPYVESLVPGGHALRPSDQAQLGRAERGFKAASSVVRRPDGEIQVSHTPLLYLVDERGLVQVEWEFGIAPARLAQDLRRLLPRKE